MLGACGRVGFSIDSDVVALKVESVLCHKSFAFHSDHFSNTLKIIGSLVVGGHNEREVSIRTIN